MPRMELTAAVVSVKVSSLLQREIDYQILKELFWTDSQVVISYICNEARRFHTFVANRVQLIRDHTTTDQWNYVSTNDNPADDASRVLSIEDYLKSQKWFNCPEFLQRPSADWPNNMEVMSVSNEDPEVKTKCTNLVVVKVEEDVLQHSRQGCPTGTP